MDAVYVVVLLGLFLATFGLVIALDRLGDGA